MKHETVTRRKMGRGWIAMALGAALLFGAGANLARGEDGGAPAALREVVVVFKTHFDLGYTDMASNVVHRYRTTMIDEALRAVDAHRGAPPERQFAWTLAGWPLAKILEAQPGPATERAERIRKAFREGRFAVHAMPFTTHTESLEPEDLVRGLRFATRLSREAGLPLPRDAKMTDVPSHSWILPTLLVNAGVEFLHLGCNAASRSPEVPRLFEWEGPDGSRLLTMYSADGYGTGLVPPPDWPYRTWLALIHTGDNHGPPRPEEVTALFDEARRRLPGVRVRLGRLGDFADAIRSEGAKVPVVRGDMPDTWIHGIMSDPRGASLARRLRPALATTEFLDTLLPVWGESIRSGAARIEVACEKSLLYGEHTWGGAYWWIYGNYHARYGEAWRKEREAGRFRRIESSWAEHTAYIEDAEALVRPLLGERMGDLARAVATDGPRVVVFNPLPWTRGGWPRIAEAPTDWSGLRSVDGEERAVLVRQADGGAIFRAQSIPGLGYRTYVPIPSNSDATAGPKPELRLDRGGGVLENRYLRLVVDTNRMVIRSFVDKGTGREWVDSPAKHGFGQFVHQRFSADDVGAFVRDYVKSQADWATNELGKPMLPPASQSPHGEESPTGFAVSFEESPGRVGITGSRVGVRGSERSFRIVLELPADEPWFEIEAQLDKEAEPWPEAGWLAFPFRLENPRLTLGRPGSLVDPRKDVVSGANRHLFALMTGVSLSGAEGDRAHLCAMDSPLVSLGEPGCWKYSRDEPARQAGVYVHLFNNQWTTNFRLWTEGHWRSRVRIGPGRADGDGSVEMVTSSLEARYPLVTAAGQGRRGTLPAAAAGVEILRRGVLVTALESEQAGGGTVVRFWELVGQTGECRMRVPSKWNGSRAFRIGLRGEGGEWIGTVTKGELVVPLVAFRPTTVALRTQP